MMTGRPEFCWPTGCKGCNHSNRVGVLEVGRTYLPTTLGGGAVLPSPHSYSCHQVHRKVQFLQLSIWHTTQYSQRLWIDTWRERCGDPWLDWLVMARCSSRWGQRLWRRSRSDVRYTSRQLWSSAQRWHTTSIIGSQWWSSSG